MTVLDLYKVSDDFVKVTIIKGKEVLVDYPTEFKEIDAEYLDANVLSVSIKVHSVVSTAISYLEINIW